MPTTKKITKAQEKRNRQFRESITNRLTVLFNPFRNYNYKSFVDGQIAPHTTILESHWAGYENKEEAFKALEGKTFRELDLDVRVDPYTREGGFRQKTRQEMAEAKEVALDSPITSSNDLVGKLRDVQLSRSVMSTLELHRLNWLLEVKEGFDGRFNKMIDKMCKSIEPKGSYFRIEVEELSNSWNEFEVLIRVEDTTFHARAIWVNGTQMVSHYRFITTTRKN